MRLAYTLRHILAHFKEVFLTQMLKRKKHQSSKVMGAWPASLPLYSKALEVQAKYQIVDVE